MIHKLFEDFAAARKALHDHVGYVEDWRVLPEDDCTDMHWQIEGAQDERGKGGIVRFAECIASLPTEDDDGDGNYYENEIYTQRHLPKWIYRGEELTMVVVDAHTDGNQLLQFFRNDMEVK